MYKTTVKSLAVAVIALLVSIQIVYATEVTFYSFDGGNRSTDYRTGYDTDDKWQWAYASAGYWSYQGHWAAMYTRYTPQTTWRPVYIDVDIDGFMYRLKVNFGWPSYAVAGVWAYIHDESTGQTIASTGWIYYHRSESGDSYYFVTPGNGVITSGIGSGMSKRASLTS